MELLISKSLIDYNISHNEFTLINNGLKEYEEMKEKITNLKDLICPSNLATRKFIKDFSLFIDKIYHIV